MIKIKEVILVEGKYDKIKLSGLVDALIIETGGFALYTNDEKMKMIRDMAKKRGVIIFTDSDRAGFQIRSYLGGCLTGIDKSLIKHAYAPDVYGKEKRKSKPGKEGKLGVEGLSSELIIQSLLKAGATPAPGINPFPITKSDMMEDGLAGQPMAAENRRKLAAYLDLPARISANALLDYLNATMTREEYKEAVKACCSEPGLK